MIYIIYWGHLGSPLYHWGPCENLNSNLWVKWCIKWLVNREITNYYVILYGQLNNYSHTCIHVLKNAHQVILRFSKYTCIFKLTINYHSKPCESFTVVGMELYLQRFVISVYDGTNSLFKAGNPWKNSWSAFSLTLQQSNIALRWSILQYLLHYVCELSHHFSDWCQYSNWEK